MKILVVVLMVANLLHSDVIVYPDLKLERKQIATEQIGEIGQLEKQ